MYDETIYAFISSLFVIIINHITFKITDYDNHDYLYEDYSYEPSVDETDGVGTEEGNDKSFSVTLMKIEPNISSAKSSRTFFPETFLWQLFLPT